MLNYPQIPSTAPPVENKRFQPWCWRARGPDTWGWEWALASCVRGVAQSPGRWGRHGGASRGRNPAQCDMAAGSGSSLLTGLVSAFRMPVPTWRRGAVYSCPSCKVAQCSWCSASGPSGWGGLSVCPRRTAKGRNVRASSYWILDFSLPFSFQNSYVILQLIVYLFVLMPFCVWPLKVDNSCYFPKKIRNLTRDSVT